MLSADVLSVSCKWNTGYDFYLVGVYCLCSVNTNIFIKAFSNYLREYLWWWCNNKWFYYYILNDYHSTNEFKRPIAAHGYPLVFWMCQPA